MMNSRKRSTPDYPRSRSPFGKRRSSSRPGNESRGSPRLIVVAVNTTRPTPLTTSSSSDNDSERRFPSSRDGDRCSSTIGMSPRAMVDPARLNDQSSMTTSLNSNVGGRNQRLLDEVAGILHENAELKKEILQLTALQDELNNQLKLEVHNLQNQLLINSAENAAFESEIALLKGENEEISRILGSYYLQTDSGRDAVHRADPLDCADVRRDGWKLQHPQIGTSEQNHPPAASPQHYDDDPQNVQDLETRDIVCKHFSLSREQPVTPLQTATEQDFHSAGAYSIRTMDICFGEDVDRLVRVGISAESPWWTEAWPLARGLPYVRKETYICFKDRFPAIHEVLVKNSSSSNHHTFATFIKMIQDSAREARRRDTYKMKILVLDLILNSPQGPDSVKIVQVVPPLSKTDKSGRGYRHATIAAVLAPRESIADLYFGNSLQQESMLGNLMNGRVKMTSESLFAFLYDLSEFEAASPMQGLLRGYILLRAWKCIYVGPKASQSDKPTGYPKTGFIDKYKVKTVTINQIAYAAVHVCFSLSTEESWSRARRVGAFDFDVIYQNIVKLHHEAPQEWKDDLIAFWNREVLGVDAASKPQQSAT
ncbi:hypothetical protein E1B28_000257 [Marasmius oreades]|uniref:Uncharacterized protein n=1 Tax=Marasmius oreades TaxID=181124 RepID=A0A9P8AE57_9AGAR|nr:uncharacterized protein E1B28_000257 [Marasmius oreades]KAG7098294.1 hypothetical protein E1B28_000257 [Marasmius oreades]